jgi:hypothetical protein
MKMSWSRILNKEAVEEWRRMVEENEKKEKRKLKYFEKELVEGTEEYEKFMEGDY